MPGLCAGADRGDTSQRPKYGKKNRWRIFKRHRLKDGIPKEEEEKPRKQILQQTMVQCNSYFLAVGHGSAVFPSVFVMLAIT
jgi:hypothetical protein